MNPYEPPKSKVDDVLPNEGPFRYKAGETYRASPALLRWAARCELLSIPLLLSAVGLEIVSASRPEYKGLGVLLAAFATAASLIVYYALSLLLTERSQYRQANWAIMAAAWYSIISTVMQLLSWLLSWPEGDNTQMVMLFIAGAVTLWVGIMLLRNPDPLWGLGRTYAITAVASGIAMMTVLLAVLALVPMVWSMVVGVQLYGRAAQELEKAQAKESA
jgi:hypothetical protein